MTTPHGVSVGHVDSPACLRVSGVCPPGHWGPPPAHWCGSPAWRPGGWAARPERPWRPEPGRRQGATPAPGWTPWSGLSRRSTGIPSGWREQEWITCHQRAKPYPGLMLESVFWVIVKEAFILKKEKIMENFIMANSYTDYDYDSYSIPYLTLYLFFRCSIKIDRKVLQNLSPTRWFVFLQYHSTQTIWWHYNAHLVTGAASGRGWAGPGRPPDPGWGPGRDQWSALRDTHSCHSVRFPVRTNHNAA